MNLLLVEDDQALATSLNVAFTALGYTVSHAQNVQAARRCFADVVPDIAVIDWQLPDGDGIGVMHDLRRRYSSVPVLILTARDRLADRVHGLESGADDYLVKPFEMAELRARIGALLRRREGAIAQEIQVGGLRFNPNTETFLHHASALALSAREHACLRALMSARGRCVAKGILFEAIYGNDHSVGIEAVEVYVSRLRRKIDGTGATIRNMRERGYSIEKDVV
jgi:DNA-binding response OmpR family regulator